MTRALCGLLSGVSGGVLALALFGCALGACDPSDPCDPGYYADHGACYRLAAGDAAVDDDAGSEPAADAGRYAGFGDSCSKQSDCPPSAPACGAPMLPVCTVVNCLDKGPGVCPPGWNCMDVKAVSPDPAIESVCVNF
jgi:hypothetical protein